MMRLKSIRVCKIGPELLWYTLSVVFYLRMNKILLNGMCNVISDWMEPCLLVYLIEAERRIYASVT